MGPGGPKDRPSGGTGWRYIHPRASGGNGWCHVHPGGKNCDLVLAPSGDKPGLAYRSSRIHFFSSKPSGYLHLRPRLSATVLFKKTYFTLYSSLPLAYFLPCSVHQPSTVKAEH